MSVHSQSFDLRSAPASASLQECLLLRRKLVRLLRVAYSSELGAALAYRGHARAVCDPYEQRMLQQIEQEEWVHRANVLAILFQLGERPSRLREVIFTMIGNVLLRLSPYSGWVLPMYVAGRMETMNVDEYTRMGDWASRLGFFGMSDELEAMAEVERQHERFFQERLALWRAGKSRSS